VPTQTPGFEIDGIAELEARLAATMARVGVASEAGLRAVAISIINEAKLFAAVDTGRMRASLSGGPDAVGPGGIRNDNTLQGPGVIVGTNVDYAFFVEFGTRFMSAQPFLRPALEVVRATMVGEVRAVIRTAVPELN
jgi:HK97 gp10 family phage protein